MRKIEGDGKKMSSPLTRGEWIEIAWIAVFTSQQQSPLTRGEWIEIWTAANASALAYVSPHPRGVDRNLKARARARDGYSLPSPEGSG